MFCGGIGAVRMILTSAVNANSKSGAERVAKAARAANNRLLLETFGNDGKNIPKAVTRRWRVKPTRTA